ncbi:MAG: hypothetical protein AB7H71_05160 [Alphaproteobacteria bacterium]
MKAREIAEAAAPEGQEDSDDLFEMANLYPDETGLPMTVWASPRGNARHNVRVKVNTAHGNRMDIANTAIVGVRPTPRVIAGRLAPADAQAVFHWIALNRDALVAYSEGRIGTIELATALRPISARQPPGPGSPSLGP